MSNYPPPPYGTPFHTNGLVSPHVGGYSSGIVQHPYQQQSQAPYYYGQSQSNGMSPAPNANAYSFGANAQDVRASVPSNGVNHGAPFAGYHGQTPYNTLPAPPYPPIPKPYGAYSHAPQYPSQPPPRLNTVSAHPFPLSHLSGPQQSTNVNTAVVKPLSPALPELEDGEVDDAEPDNIVNHPEAASMGSRISRSPGGEQDESEGPRITATYNNEVTQASQLAQDSPSEPDGQISISSPQPHRPPMQNGFVDRSRDLPSSQLDDLSESQSLEKSSLGRLGEPAILIAGKAHEARQALHDLHSTGYKFDQIVKKGLNPEILKGLYTESGILRTHSPSAQQQDQVIGSTAGGAPMTGTLDTVYIVKNVNRGQPQHSKEVSYIANASGNDKPLLRSKDTSNINSLISVTTTKDDKPPNTLPKSIKGVLGKIPGTKAGDSKVVDRKEYIARMLAAKAGKPASSAGASIIPKATTSTDADSVIQTITLPAPSTISSATLQQDVQPITEPKIDPSPQTAKEDLEVEANKKAQTDLARQKIDALRFRASKQQDARRAASDESNHQSKQPLSAPQTQGLFDIPLTASQPTLSSRQGSYFSPMSQKPPFSIPGLFMTSDTLESAKSSQQMESQVLGASQQRDNQAISRAVQQQFHSIAFNAPKLASRTTERSPLPGYNVDTGNSPLPSLRSSPTITHRKRQKAADFIDSPATRVKRPFGQQEHSSVIIDISEDDASSLEDNGLDMEIDDGRDSLPPQSHTGDTGNEKPKSFRDVPPLTEFPSQKKAADVIPPAIQALTQVKDLKGLKSKEMEIESMNRRIKELEERIMAKRTTSRAQTPGAFGSTTVSSPASQSSHKVSDQPSAITGVARPTDRSTSPTPAQHSSLAAVDNTESATEEQLVVEQRLQEAELAKAEAERSPAANVVRASEEHRRLQEEISQAPERDEQKQLRDQEQRQRQDELQHVRLHRAEQQRPREKSLQQAQEEGAIRAREADDRLPRQQQQTLEEEGQRRLQEEQRQLRKTEIESDLPILNATAERTREKLESLRGEIADLDKEFQKGVEDKKILMDELYRLSQTTATIEMPVEPTLPAFNVPRAEVVTRGESTQAPVMEISEPVLQQCSGAAAVIQEHSATPQAVHSSVSLPQAVGEALSDGVLKEDVMDISRSDIDEGEITQSNSDSVAEAHGDSGMIDDEESYKPPSDIGARQRMLNEVQSDDEPEKADINMQDNTPTGDANAGNISDVPHSIEEISNNASMQHEEHSAHRSPSLADYSDPEDYEPPEPSRSAEETALPLPISAHDSEASFSPLEADPNDVDAPTQSVSQPGVPSGPKDENVGANPLEGTAQGPIRQIGHFTPYESPLKQFRSFRYHPKYFNEVSNGFRSLTYSHAINPETPVCRYELGGTCNDSSCQSQHLKSMGLSDEKILVDLGATPDGLSQEDAEAFTNGLRELIHDIRSRKIKDFYVVAREITEHRARFLGDPSKVLSLYSKSVKL